MVSAFFALILAGPLASQASFPTGTVGTYTALLDRHPWYNGGCGGLLKLTVTSSGSYSGRITRGMHSKAFKGKLRFHEDGITPIGSFAVTRVKSYTPPAKGEQLLGITPSIANIILGITDWAVEVFDGISFTLWHDNRIFMPVLGSAENLPRITLRADLKTGIVTGKVGALGYNSYMPSLARSGTFSALISPQAAIEGSPTHCIGHLLVSAHNAPQAPIHSYLIETF